ncbi:PAS domain S-box protein [Mongoliitalea daihaiensis]|uniref:PAS domain S-box protein n=1 Tax=Mongoliitalea daihaiensis TaxID=2782006 RepID=UPI001F293934|nr:PAS domain S-box protein [Mongoliitalea daihaiensis]UJP65924.1 PAS domain S-box protein [Mongoliitalea daihaiensis]
MSNIVVASSKNILLTFKKHLDSKIELLYISTEARSYAEEGEKFYKIEFIESLFPTFNGSFFYTIFDELGKGDKPTAPILIGKNHYQFVEIEGYVIAMEDGSYLVNALISPLRFPSENKYAWIFQNDQNKVYNALINKEKVEDVIGWKNFIKESFDFLSADSIAQFEKGNEDAVITLFPGYLYLTKKKISASHCLVKIEYSKERNVPQAIDEGADNFYYYELDQESFQYNWSGPIHKLLGYTDEFLRMISISDWKKLIHPDDHHIYEMGQSHAINMVYRILHNDGHYIFIKDDLKKFTNYNTNKTLGTVSDITTLKKIENDLLQNKTVLEELTGVVPGMVYLMKTFQDLTHQFIFVSEGCKQLTEIDANNFIDHESTLFKIIHPDDLEILLEADRAAFEKDQSFECYFRIITPSGKIKWIYGASDRLKQYENDSIWAGIFVDVTQSKDKEEEANLLMNRYRLLFDESPLPIFRFTKEGIIQDVNKSFTEKIDITDKEILIGKNIFDLIGDNPIKQAYLDCINKGFGFFEGPYLSYFNQKLFHLRATAKPIDNGENFQAILEDISEQEYVHNIISKLTERTSKFSGQEFFDALTEFFSLNLQMSDCFIAEIDSTKNAAKVISYHQNGKKQKNFIYDLEHTPCKECLSSGTPLIIPNQAYKKYPLDTYLVDRQVNSYMASPIHDAEGNQLGLLVMFDCDSKVYGAGKKEFLNVLSDRIGAELNRINFENRLIESEQLFRSIAENFPKGIVEVLDNKLFYVYTDGKEYHDMGIDPNQLVGTAHLSKYESYISNEVRKQLDKVLQGESVMFEVIIGDRYYLKSGVPLYNKQGKIDRILLVTQNITETKIAEEEREQLIRDLKSQNEELQRFAYIISHNLRAPIVNISSLLELYNTKNPSDVENEEVIHNLKISTDILNDTLKDLIEVVSIKKNKVPKIENIQFKDLTTRVLTSLANQIKESGAIITKDFSECSNISYIFAHLENFLMNLTTNSLKYKHPDRKPEIFIRTFKDSEGFVVLEFKDNGIGIDLERYGDRLFGLYQRFHSHVEGKGLGLYLVREQIRAHDGNLKIKSKVGEGTVFHIFLRNLKPTTTTVAVN